MRFTSRRGVPEKIWSDNGTNFVGGERELNQAINSWNSNHRLKDHLLLKNIDWSFNPPHASHMGGVWERQIRSIRKVLNSILKDQILTDESLNTLFCEVESVINGRPITSVSDDPNDQRPLTPNHLLLLRGGAIASLSEFQLGDCYRKRWRHVQFLADQFWKRWLREYLPNLAKRQKWVEPKANFKVGDVVLVMDENSPRKSWPLGLVTRTFAGRDGLVRSVEVKMNKTLVVRPIHKLAMLEAVVTDI